MAILLNWKQNPNYYDVIIIGAGPAGLTAAIYCQRSNLKTAIIEKATPGGKMAKTAVIENYPGFSTIEGFSLSLKMLEQAKELGSSYIYGEVSKIYKNNDGIFFVSTQLGETFYAGAVIVATGMKEKLINIPGEVEYYGKGVSYCAICDGSLYKDKIVAVIGGGNSAVEESIYLADIVKEVHLFHRRDEFRADPIVVKKARSIENIIFHTSCIPKKIIGDKKVNKLIYEDLKTNTEYELDLECVFPFVGFIPETNFIADDQINKQNGFLIADNNMRTNTPGLFAAGDVLVKDYRQISTAINDGTIAALSAKKYLDNID